MLQNLLRNKKSTGLIIVGLAAFAYYRYSKMSAEEKDNLVNAITKTGKDLLGQIMRSKPKNEIANGENNNYSDAVVL